MTAAELNPELRTLIDARLESLDRILTSAQIGWSERRSIVGEVETQIYELLARRSQLPTREDVLAVLGQLDPPEAYLPEELRAEFAQASQSAAEPTLNWRELPQHTLKLLEKLAPGAVFVAGLVVANGVVLVIIGASHGVIPWIVTLSGLAWVNYVGVKQFRTWSALPHGNLIHDIRQSLAAWLTPKNGAVAA